MLKSLLSKGLVVPHMCENCYSIYTSVKQRHYYYRQNKRINLSIFVTKNQEKLFSPYRPEPLRGNLLQ